jgi:hypothetical protein
MFELDKIQEERDILEAILTDVKNNKAGREANMEEVQ